MNIPTPPRIHRALSTLVLLCATAFSCNPVLAAQDGPAYGGELQGFEYPHSVQHFVLQSQQQELQMAYMDLMPTTHGNGHTVVLMHGKNYCSATWEPNIPPLRAAGYRVVAIDQIGFCKSSKPESYQFTFEQLAHNTHDLLASLHIDKPIMVAHSTGGMLAIRYALSYPQDVRQLILVDPIGLEDWRAKGVPPVSLDQWNVREMSTSADRIRNYEKNTYFAGQWRADYEASVQMLAGLYRGPDRARVAWNSAQLYDMILTQPVFYQLEQLTVPTVLIIGDKDTTAIGKEFAPQALRPTLGRYPELAEAAVKRIPDAKLIRFAEAGHAPQMQDPTRFNAILVQELAKTP